MTDGADEDELPRGIKTMRAWGILPKIFPKPDLSAFYTFEDIMEKVRIKISAGAFMPIKIEQQDLC